MTRKETDENTKCDLPAQKILDKIENGSKATMADYFFTEKDVLGYTVNINTARATIRVNDLSRITLTAVGRLVVIETVENESLIARIESIEEKSEDRTNVYYYIFVGFIGTFVVNQKKQKSCVTKEENKVRKRPHSRPVYSGRICHRVYRRQQTIPETHGTDRQYRLRQIMDDRRVDRAGRSAQIRRRCSI
jgi:hypothetical protein